MNLGGLMTKTTARTETETMTSPMTTTGTAEDTAIAARRHARTR
jgi:hypothetical protein